MHLKAGLVVALVAVVGIAGCADTVEIDHPQNLAHVTKSNFEIGVAQTVSVGAPMIKVNDYYISEKAGWSWKTDTTIRGGGITAFNIPPGIYGVGLQKKVGSEIFDVIRVNGQELLITQDGRVAKTTPEAAFVAYDVHPSDPSARLDRVKNTALDTTKGYVNYELIYTGSAQGTIHLTYREFTPEDLAKTAFYQELSYNSSDPIIRFKGLTIRVIAADNTGITFRVEKAGAVADPN